MGILKIGNKVWYTGTEGRVPERSCVIIWGKPIFIKYREYARVEFEDGAQMFLPIDELIPMYSKIR